MATQLTDEAGEFITDEDGALIEVEEVGPLSLWSHAGIPAGASPRPETRASTRSARS